MHGFMDRVASDSGLERARPQLTSLCETAWGKSLQQRGFGENGSFSGHVASEVLCRPHRYAIRTMEARSVHFWDAVRDAEW